MSTIFKADIDLDEVLAQSEQEKKSTFTKKKVEYDAKHYLDTILPNGVQEKSLTVRLLPFSPEGGLPFHKIWVHTVRVNKEFASSGWKQFICPNHNGYGKPCPFCEMQEKTKELLKNETDEAKRKQLSNIEFANRAREFWVVRCIDRDHEEDGVKFWTFPHSKKNDGIYDKIMNVCRKRKESAERKGKIMNIFSLENGKDLEITIRKDSNGKNVYNIVDSDETSPLSEDVELANSWIENTMKWDDVYVIKPYDFLSIALEMKIPIYDKEQGCYVAKKNFEEYIAEKKAKENDANEVFEEEKPDSVKSFEEKIATKESNGYNSQQVIDDDDDLPF